MGNPLDGRGLEPPVEPRNDRRLESWKEIAAYLKRDIKTVQRWEKREGLPVHRHLHDKLGSVYAYSGELDRWRSGRPQAPARVTLPGHEGLTPASHAHAIGGHRARRRRLTWAGAVAAVLAAVTLLAYRRLSDEPLAIRPVGNSLAILPFRPLVADARDEFLELGMADALITRLSNLSQIGVRPMSAVLKYATPSQDPRAAGRELGVDLVLEGKLQRAGDRLRVTVQLLRVRDGTPLWADTFHESVTDIFSVQDAIAAKVTRALMLRLTQLEEALITKRSTDSPEAYQLYLKGRYFVNKRNEDGYRKAIDYFRQALAIDGNDALAYAGLADAYNLLGFYVTSAARPRDVFPQATEAARRALRIDSSLPEAHAALGYTKLLYDWDWAGARAAFERAIELKPTYATAHQGYAQYFSAMGRTHEAIDRINRARELDPFSLIINRGVGRHLYFARQYDGAIEQERHTLELEPGFAVARYSLGLAYAQKGMFGEAISELEQAVALTNGGPVFLGALGYAYARAGRRAEAEQVIARLNDMSRRRYVSAFNVALVHAGLGEADSSLQWLERAYAERATILVFLKVHPEFDGLRTHPRFTALLRRIGLTS